MKTALDELMSNQWWMIHDLVDGDQIDNKEERKLQKLTDKAAAELAALTAELEAVKRERDELREALKQAADELWGKHYRTAKTEWATDDVAKHYADKLVDNYKTIAKEAGQK